MDTSSLVYVIPEGKQKPKFVSLVPTDLGSRYKTRQLQIQIQGKSKMIKTVLCNILDVAKDMQIPATYPGCYFGFNIGAQPHFDTKKAERQQAYLSGEHEPKVLSKLMEQFVTEVLLCPNCGLPETTLSVDKKEVMGTCRACGTASKLNLPNARFKNYVLNHPPATPGATFTANKAIKEQRKGKKGGDGEEDDENGEDEEEKEETPAEVEKKVVEETQQKLASDKKADDIEWFSDTSEQARRKRREAMLPESMTVSRERNGEVRKLLEPTPDVAKLAELKKELQLDDKQFLSIVCKELFSISAPDEAFCKNHQALFGKFAATKDARLELLRCLEVYAIEDPKKQLLPKISKVVHACYNLDLVEEEDIRKWVASADPTVKAPMAPLMKWLDEAEEDEDGEGDEE